MVSLLMLCAARSAKNHRGGSVLWTPANLATPPVLWLNDTSAVTDDGTGHCSQWNDISGNGYNAGQTTSTARPAITSGGLNGLRVITFNGSSDYMNWVNTTGAATLAKNASQLCYFILTNPAPASSTNRLMNWSVGSGGAGSSARAAMYVGSVSANTVAAFQRKPDSSSAANASKSYSTQAWHLWEAEHNWVAGTVAISMDGNAATTTNTGQGSGTSDNTNSNFIEMGGTATTGSQCMNGSIAEFVVLTYIPGTSDFQKMVGSLLWKWGLQANIPSGNPYKTAPPYV